ncbi:hypothetical protein [Parasediminibacterium sp. JCM 36343]|uniref:hypothetical protein n=1 Tax=Parasediminibacterium sp. JCM 36343 TaxID=3374279 RepID=UPI00397D4D06
MTKLKQVTSKLILINGLTRNRSNNGFAFSYKCTFPVRGCLVSSDIEFNPFNIPNNKGITFYNSSLYGQALIDAYMKAEFQDWAGCYIDRSALAKIDDAQLIESYICKKKI